MLIAAQQVLVLAGTAVGLTLGLLVLRSARTAWRRQLNPVDLAMSVAASVWLLYLLAMTSLNFAASNFSLVPISSAHLDYATHVGYQALIVSVGFFLLTCAGVANLWVYLLLVGQAGAGAMALHWHSGEGGAQVPAYQAWIAVNLLAATLLTGVVALRVYQTRSYSSWLALAGCVIGLGLGVDEALLVDHVRRFAMLSYYFYAAFLLLIWHLITQRGGGLETLATLTHDFLGNTGFKPLTGLGHDQDVAASAVALERRRIAQELHDGVASQIVNILSSLDSKAPSPQQQALALALEQCLVDLKMTVDAIDSADDNVLESLGRLRYRMQHSLDKLGIRMVWEVQICDELEAVRGVQAQQVLRIAQESLANVMRHAQASVVEVVCRCVPETGHMVLEVRDNGQGIARSKSWRPSGKGLEGMRRRAQAVGGELVISGNTGAGTCVRLSLPLAASIALPQPTGGSGPRPADLTRKGKGNFSPRAAG